nr:phage major capsid protein [Clostridium botulinum]
MKSEDEGAIAQAFTNFAENVQQNILDDVKAYQETSDKEILAKRGVHQLTQKETKFYQGIIDAMKNENPRQAFTGLDASFPETVIDNIMEDIKANHPLLDVINFTNTSILTKILINKKGIQLATWSQLNSEITKELEGSIGKIDLTLCKLSAFMPVSKDMLEIGPQWIDAYVRATLSEAIAYALEEAIVNGTGKDMPIGMNRDVSDNVSVTGGEYPKKTKVSVTSLDPVSYGAILGKLATGPNDKTRPVSNVLMIVNPKDYFTKVFPATTVRMTDGTYNHDVLPFPTTIIQSTGVEAGECIFGLGSKYFLGIGAGTTGGKIEFSDEYKFLEDERTYLTKMYGNGRALDNNAFVLADITGLKAAVLEVSVKEVEGTVKTKEQA